MVSPARPPARLRIVIAMPDGGRRPRGLASWLASIAPAAARGELTVALVSDRRMRTLNRTFRGVDRATDVLSFPAVGEAPGMRSHGETLGDIAIAAGVAARQAGDAGHSFSTECRVLALHGLLHVLGYDHDVDGGRMARVEARLRRRGGLPAGLIDRAARQAKQPR